MFNNKHNFTIFQGQTFEANVNVRNANNTAKNLAGYSAEMQIREYYHSNTIAESLSAANGEIVINSTSGTLSLTLTSDRTEALTVDLYNGKPPKSTFVYDLELVEDASNTVSKILYGDFIVYGEVTKPA
jgi:hypothetical protein